MVLSTREGFIAWYSAFQMAHTVANIDLDDLNEAFLDLYYSVMDTIWQSKYSTLTLEEINELMGDVNMELISTRDILAEAIEQDKLGERI